MDKPESKKFTHDQVGYEFPSTHPGQHCVGCEHFIPATDKMPAGCEGVQRPIQLAAWCHRFEPMEKNMKHGFTHSHIEHHSDGSHTIHHFHHKGPEHDVKHAVADLDGVHDSMQDHLGTPNPGEASADAGDHGVPPPMAGAAGLPAPAPAQGA